MRNVSGWFCFVLLLGAVVGFSAGRWSVKTQSIDNKSTRYLAGTMSYGQGTDAFMIFDTQTNKLLAYTIGGNRRLELLAAREVTWDLRLSSWGKQEPTAQEVKDAFDKAEKDREKHQKDKDKGDKPDSTPTPTTTEFFSDYYDGGLQSAERTALEEHLRCCSTCTTEYRHFTRSLEALHETAPLETTTAFMTNLKASASQQIDRRQGYPKTKSEAMTIVTPKADSRPLSKSDSKSVAKTAPLAKLPSPAWVPWALAATTLAAFALGFAVSGRRQDPEQEQELVAAIEELRDLKKKPVVPAPVNEQKILEANGLVEVDGQWIPRKWRDDFKRNMVALNGQMMTREQAAKELAREFPVAAAEPPPPPPSASNAPPVPSSEEILDKAGYSRVNDVAVPKAWLEKWAEGYVQIGVGEWCKKSDFKEELIKEHNLVEIRGKLM